VLAEDVLDPETNKTLFKRNTLLDEGLVDSLEEQGVDEVIVRSPIICEMRFGVCSACYGRDLARGHRAKQLLWLRADITRQQSSRW